MSLLILGCRLGWGSISHLFLMVEIYGMPLKFLFRQGTHHILSLPTNQIMSHGQPRCCTEKVMFISSSGRHWWHGNEKRYLISTLGREKKIIEANYKTTTMMVMIAITSWVFTIWRAGQARLRQNSEPSIICHQCSRFLKSKRSFSSFTSLLPFWLWWYTFPNENMHIHQGLLCVPR